MKGRGFDYVVAPYIDSEAELARLQNPLNEAIAQEYGYHIPPLPATVPPIAPNELFAKALQGDGSSNDSGCAGSLAVKQLRDVSDPSFDLYAELMFSLDQVTDNKFFASANFEQLSTAWSKCMATAGYKYDGWFGPLTEFSSQPSVTKEELAVRWQDLSCDRQVGLTKSRSNLQRVDFERWMTEQELQIDHLLALVAEASKAVAQLESEHI